MKKLLKFISTFFVASLVIYLLACILAPLLTWIGTVLIIAGIVALLIFLVRKYW